MSFTGFKLDIDPISPELVNSARPLFFGITSDVITANLSDFVIVLANILLLLLVQLVLSQAKKSSLAKQFFDYNKWDMGYGQIINLIIPATLPWSFILLQSGAQRFPTKCNFVLYYFALFISLLFPIYYLFSLLEGQRRQIRDKRK